MNNYQKTVLYGFVNSTFMRLTNQSIKIVGLPTTIVDGRAMSTTDNMYKLGIRMMRELNHNSKRYAKLNEVEYVVVLVTDMQKADIDTNKLDSKADVFIDKCNEHFIGFDVVDKSTREVYVSIRLNEDNNFVFLNDSILQHSKQVVEEVCKEVRAILNSDRVKMTWDFEEALLATLTLVSTQSANLREDNAEQISDVFKLIKQIKFFLQKYYDDNPSISGFQELSKFGCLEYIKLAEILYRTSLLSLNYVIK